MKYYCLNCKDELNGNKRKYCSNSCKCKYFYKNNSEKCNLWNKKNPKPKVKNNCINCGKPCGRNKYCSDKCKPKIISVPAYFYGMMRLNSKCNICNKTYQVLVIHHKDGNHENNDINNLIALCSSCHQRVHQPKNNECLKNDLKSSKIYELRSILKS